VHQLRDFRFHAESPLAHQSEFGKACLQIAEGVFEGWREFQRSGERRALRRSIRPLERQLRELCEQAQRKSVKTRYHRGLARNLIETWPALWTFVQTEGVEPTNNRAERGLRHAVIYRKLSQGSRCEQGALAPSGCSAQRSAAASNAPHSSPTSSRSPRPRSAASPRPRWSETEPTERLPEICRHSIWARLDSNQRPTDYESAALTN
jgi:Transposase IS66 family